MLMWSINLVRDRHDASGRRVLYGPRTAFPRVLQNFRDKTCFRFLDYMSGLIRELICFTSTQGPVAYKEPRVSASLFAIATLF